ncbi:MAG TPA: PaaI family thioesterase [Ramlibacter sp.]
MEFSADTLARLNDNPLYAALGIRIDHCDGGNARATLAPTPNACWPSRGNPHGGVLFTVIDTTMAWAAMSLAGDGESVATVDCSIQYPAPATHGPFTCEAASVRKTGRTVFMRAEILDGRGGVVALGQGTFRIIREKTD